MSNTECRNPKAGDIDIMPVSQILNLMNEEDLSVIEAVKTELKSIEKAVDMAVEAIKRGGRIFYAGAGTSGRLGVLDASEIPPTFGVSSDLFQAIIAGGERAILTAIEGAEDDENAGITEASVVSRKDFVLGISASGKTPYVLAFLNAAKEKGALCWLLTCNDAAVICQFPTQDSGLRTIALDGVIKVLTGPEIIAGSTRLKAGTATKLVLNMFSTAAMIRLGRVYKGLMVDVAPTNKKLVDRAEGIIMQTTGCTREDASQYLQLAGMRTKVAIVMKAKGVSREEAEGLLEKSGGHLRPVIADC